MVFLKNNHFKVAMYANSLLGIWPFIFEDKRTLRLLYDAYSKFLLTAFVIFIILAAIQLVVLLFSSTVLEIMRNMCVTMLRIITTLRLLAIRGGTIRNLIRKIIATEDAILGSGDEEVVKIYNSHARQSQIINVIFIFNMSIAAGIFMIYGFLEGEVVEFDSATNQTVVTKPMPISTWFPFDHNKHYKVSFWLQVWDGYVGSLFVMFVDAFNFSMIIFPLGQIKILSHVLSNFHRYASRIKDQLGCGGEEASFITFRECVLRHKDIISYLNNYNNTMKNIMVLDFLQSSLQLASIIIQLLLTTPTIFSADVLVHYAICMIIRLLTYYWYANEIMLQSDWYEEPHKVKLMMILMIMRANKSLTLDIGSFSKMTLEVFLKVINTTYSYMMIMYNV